MSVFTIREDQYYIIKNLIEDKIGICILEDKKYFVENRLYSIMQLSDINSFEDIIHALKQSENIQLFDSFIDMITTNETFWFRDKATWRIFEEVLMPKYIQELRDGSRKDVRIWSCASSTGQEPYTLAICINNYIETHGIKDIGKESFYILGSDISNSAIETARTGIYDHISMQRGMDETLKNKYFEHTSGGSWNVCPRVKDMVHFTRINLKETCMYPNEWDLILCRNILIYFAQNLKIQILDNLKKSLRYDGAILIGSSEIINDFYKGFNAQHYKDLIYYK